MPIAALLLTQLHLQYSYFYKGDRILTKSLKEAMSTTGYAYAFMTMELMQAIALVVMGLIWAIAFLV
ncbi:hypothetical protein LC653_42045 [Nostoc sp. CHAB 5784]|uniref:hypothetical protein n=1 Tax=Nostoc mirabile TaxID=2907820 RepID=UPI001E5B66A3|nr:hypothetical protein [Nostoc mirabile]MCC5670204.1 hypothetical protein [Nostoc mirabile CHAB5784]